MFSDRHWRKPCPFLFALDAFIASWNATALMPFFWCPAGSLLMSPSILTCSEDAELPIAPHPLDWEIFLKGCGMVLSAEESLHHIGQLGAVLFRDRCGGPFDHHATHILRPRVADQNAALVSKLFLHLTNRLLDLRH
jgi:hypothetical protein